MRAWIAMSLACLALGGCRAKDPAGLETAFEREKAGFARAEFDDNTPCCRGSGATAFRRGDDVVMIEHVVGTSTRWYRRNYYYEGGRLGLAVQRTWWTKDDHAEELKEPRPESTTRFLFEPGRTPRLAGDPPPDETSASDLIEESARLLRLAGAK